MGQMLELKTDVKSHLVVLFIILQDLSSEKLNRIHYSFLGSYDLEGGSNNEQKKMEAL